MIGYIVRDGQLNWAKNTMAKNSAATIAREVFKLYERTNDYILRDIAEYIEKHGFEGKSEWREALSAHHKLILKRLDALLKSEDKTVKEALKVSISDDYLNGKRQFIESQNLNQVLTNFNVPQSVFKVIAETQNNLLAQHGTILRTTDDMYRQLTSEAVLDELTKGLTRRQATQELLNKFANNGIATFVDKSGKTWDLASYAEMAIRTGGIQAKREGMIAQAVSQGYNLFKVTRHIGSCKICQQFEAMIVCEKEDGKHPTIAQIRESGFGHPNCSHGLIPYVPDLDEEGNEVADVIKTFEGDVLKASGEEYQARQDQRGYERESRHYRKLLSSAVTTDQRMQATNGIFRATQAIEKLTKEYNIPRKQWREYHLTKQEKKNKASRSSTTMYNEIKQTLRTIEKVTDTIKAINKK